MGALTAIIPLIQAISMLVSLWGVIHVAPTAETIVHYGVSGPEGVNWAQLANSGGALLIGGMGFLTTWWAKNKTGAKSELVIALLQFVANRASSNPDPTMWRRVLLAFVDLLDEQYGKDADQQGWQFVKDWLGQKALSVKADLPTMKG